MGFLLTNREKNQNLKNKEFIHDATEEKEKLEEVKKTVENKIINYKKIITDILNEFIINRPHLINAVERGVKSKNDLKKEILKFLEEQEIKLESFQEEELIERFEQTVWGYGILQPLIDDPDISDIKTVNYNNIRIKVKGERRKSDIEFEDADSMKTYINYIAVKNNSVLSEVNAIQKFTDKNSSKDFILRINISSEFINSNELPCLIIRKISKKKYTLDQLKDLNMFDVEVQEYLEKAAECGLSMFFTGKGASGKTTLMNALIDKIPYEKSCLVIQEAEELFTYRHPDILFQKVRYSKGDGTIEYNLRDLSVNGLLMDLDYFIIGEIKGAEAYDMVNAIYTGHVGITSVHGNSAIEAINKMVHYMKYVSDMKRSELLEMLSNIDVVVFMKDFKIMEITEVAGFDYEKQKIIFNKVFEYKISKERGEYVTEFKKINESCEKVNKKILYSEYMNDRS